MKKNANGIHPVIAIVLTIAVAALAVLLFTKGHPVWGVIFSLIGVDFLADVPLSFKRA